MADSAEEEERLNKLVAGLTDKTRQGNIAWHAVEEDDISFQATLSTSGAVIKPATAGDYYELFILDGDGREVGTADDHGGSPYTRGLPELYELARGKALSSDETLDRMLDELGD